MQGEKVCPVCGPPSPTSLCRGSGAGRGGCRHRDEGRSGGRAPHESQFHTPRACIRVSCSCSCHQKSGKAAPRYQGWLCPPRRWLSDPGPSPTTLPSPPGSPHARRPGVVPACPMGSGGTGDGVLHRDAAELLHAVGLWRRQPRGLVARAAASAPASEGAAQGAFTVLLLTMKSRPPLQNAPAC